MKFYQDIVLSINEKKKISAKDDPCWPGYHMVGKKTKNGREVPNCVPGKKGVAEEIKPTDTLIEPDVISMPHTETDFNVYHSAKKNRYTVRGAGQHHGKMPKRWFKHLPNAISFGRATAKSLSTE